MTEQHTINDLCHRVILGSTTEVEIALLRSLHHRHSRHITTINTTQFLARVGAARDATVIALAEARKARKTKDDGERSKAQTRAAEAQSLVRGLSLLTGWAKGTPYIKVEPAAPRPGTFERPFSRWRFFDDDFAVVLMRNAVRCLFRWDELGMILSLPLTQPTTQAEADAATQRASNRASIRFARWVLGPDHKDIDPTTGLPYPQFLHPWEK